MVWRGHGNWSEVSQRLVRHYRQAWHQSPHKITLGISAYGFGLTGRQVQRAGLVLKQTLRQHGTSLRLIPNSQAHLSTATSHHNRLGSAPHKVELLVVRDQSGRVIIAESRGAQNITAYARRDQRRPRRDAFVGMLPPKLAQMMVNMAIGPQLMTAGAVATPTDRSSHPSNTPIKILDPFCGTGTILQEALLRGLTVYGSDLSAKMIDYTIENLHWLQRTHVSSAGQLQSLRQGDATTMQWTEAPQLAAVVCETYLGQPFSAPPSPAKLRQVVGNCNHIITEFLRNIQPQLGADTTLCIAVPAWRNTSGQFTHLPLVQQLNQLGYQQLQLRHTQAQQLLYHRPDQTVARQLLLLRTA